MPSMNSASFVPSLAIALHPAAALMRMAFWQNPVRSTIEKGFSAKVQKCTYGIKKAAGSIASGLPGSKLIPRIKPYSAPARFKLAAAPGDVESKKWLPGLLVLLCPAWAQSHYLDGRAQPSQPGLRAIGSIQPRAVGVADRDLRDFRSPSTHNY